MPDDVRGLRFAEILRQAINDFAERGFIDQTQIDTWLTLLRTAAERELGPAQRIDAEVRRDLDALYRRLVEHGQVLKYIPGVGRFTLGMIRPELRSELDRRILASADLIKLHRREAIEKTLQRFQGWSTSIPAGGEGVIDKREVRQHIGKSVKQFRFERNRVRIDQSAKLVSHISEIVATGNGAIAGIWHSHWRERGYSYREEHKHFDEEVFFVRNSWAIEKGWIKKGAARYIDQVERPSELPFCRCFYQWIISPRQLAPEMLTKKGMEATGRPEPKVLRAP